ncbi:MAG TPA: putative ABC exporter domain-containing protein [Gemmatimonadaceae bacterium]|nr:putative ABC exporter domain-containing protein [Gemmatimonadaceae bacterium]
MAANDALGYLLAHTFRNRLAKQGRRLRSPKAAIALLIGVSYLIFVLGNPAGRSTFSGRPFGGVGLELAAILLLAFIARWWLFGADRQALTFSPAEVHFLFPAPVGRRAIVAYRIAKSQFVLLMNAAIWTWLFQATGAPWPARFAAFWLLFGTLHLHQLGASLVRAGMLEHGAAGARRHWLAVLVFSGVVLALGVSVVARADVIAAAAGTMDTLRAIGAALQQGPAQVVLAPLRMLIEPAVASSLADWVLALPLALLVAAAHLGWVLTSDVAFEEAAVEASERHARRLASWRDGRGRHDVPKGAVRTRLTLAPRGHPAFAILWKNAVAMIRSLRGAAFTWLGGFALAILMFSALDSKQDFYEMVGVMLMVWAGLLVMAGPLWVRYDFRRDLARLDMLRVLPVSGTGVAAAEIAGPAFAITALQFTMVAIGGLLLSASGMHLALPPAGATALLLAAALPLNAIELAVHNVYALTSPDAGRRAATRAAGIEALGVHMLVMLLSLLVLVVALTPAAMLGGLARLAVSPVHEGAGLATGAGVAFLALCAEAWLAVMWVGRVFERGGR